MIFKEKPPTLSAFESLRQNPKYLTNHPIIDELRQLYLDQGQDRDQDSSVQAILMSATRSHQNSEEFQKLKRNTDFKLFIEEIAKVLPASLMVVGMTVLSLEPTFIGRAVELAEVASAAVVSLRVFNRITEVEKQELEVLLAIDGEARLALFKLLMQLQKEGHFPNASFADFFPAAIVWARYQTEIESAELAKQKTE